MDNIYKAVQLTIDSQNLALSKNPTHIYIANQYVDTNDTPLITAPFIIQKALENGTGVVDIVSSTIGSIYEVRLLCDSEVLISGYFYMPPMNVNFSELELYTSYPPRTPPVINEFWQKTENFILEKTNTLLNFVQVFNAVSSMRLSLGYLEELLTIKKSNLVSAINEVVSVKADKATTLVGYGISDAYTKSEIDTNYGGVKTLYDKNVVAGAGANGWTTDLVVENGLTQKQINEVQKVKNKQLVTPFDFGAIGDGIYHKLLEKYTTLTDAQVKYPTAQSLDDSIDLCALESFFNHCQDNKVNANITLDAYVNRPLELGMGAKGVGFKTLVFNGDLSLVNNQTDVEIPHLMRINAADTVWLGKLRFYGNTQVAVKDRKQLAGLVVGDGGTDGSAGRIQIRSVTAFHFKCAGLVLANDSIFPRIDYVNIGWIGSTSGAWYDANGTMGGNFVDNTVANHTATITARTDIEGDYGQRSVLTVSSLPPQYSIATEYAPRMVMFEGDNLPYVIKDIDVAKNQISVYPKLKNPATTNYNRLGYIYGTGLAWQGNNAGVGAFGHIQFITCGIGFWGGSLFGANINFLSTEWCGVGFTLGRAWETAIAYNISAGYFEANVFDYVQQWGNGSRALLTLGINNNLDINLLAEMQSYRFGAEGIRLQNRFDWSSITFKNNRYDIRNPYRSSVDLSDPRDVLPAIINGGELQLTFSNFNFNSKFKMYTKTIVISNSWEIGGDNITLKAPEGWTINGQTSLTLYRKAEATVLTVTICEQNYWRNKVMFVAGESIYRPSGTTAERPANVPVGYMYLDTTLAAGGKPIYKSVNGWVDSAGTAV